MVKKRDDGKKRCGWEGTNPKYVAYHDYEWGVPVTADRELFELLILEGFQAGLSWSTILNKRQNFRQAFDNFDPEIIAEYDQRKLDRLLRDRGIIRNKLKIKSAVTNALAFLDVQEDYGSFSDYIWSFVEHRPIQNRWSEMSEVPARTLLSDQISKDLKKRGFKFVGPTIIYAYMQSIGMVNDHIVSCFRHQEIMDLVRENSLKK